MAGFQLDPDGSRELDKGVRIFGSDMVELGLEGERAVHGPGVDVEEIQSPGNPFGNSAFA